MMTKYESKHGTVAKQPYEMYMGFTDLRNLLTMIPEDKKEGIVADSDTLTANVQGMSLGVKVHQRVPYSRLEFVDYGAPFAFHVQLHFEPSREDPYKTDFWIDLEAELNFMMKMMIGSKIKDAMDKIVDGLIDPESMREEMKKQGFNV